MKKLLFILITLLDFSANAQTLEADRSALVKFYNTTNGPQWTNKTNWNSISVSPCNWFGVGCTNGRVTSLSLFNNNLSGTITIGKDEFSALRTLELTLNKLTGTIPAELGSLSSLERLAIANNQLSGQIPPGLGFLQNLSELLFSGNFLNGSIPPELFNVASLTIINLSDNQLTGRIPSAISKATNLREVYLHNNLLEGPLPDLMGYLPKLTSLFLYNNRITGSIPTSFGNLKKIIYLWLFDNQLSGAIPGEIANFSDLQSFDLHANQFTGSIPSSLGSLSKLQFINLSQNLLSGSIPTELGNLTGLTELGVGYNQLSGNIPGSLGNIAEMRMLYLPHNQLTGTIPSSLSKLSKLTGLYLSNNELTGQIPDLTGIPASAVVDFSLNNFTFDGLESNLPTIDYYHSQALVPLQVNGKTVSLNVGGTLSKNTYSWSKNDTLFAVNKGDNTLAMKGYGYYRVQVSNDLIPNFTLYSTTFAYAGALPVTLVNFTAKKSEKGNLISWITTMEVNNAGFEIQRSADAKSFVTIAKLDGNGNSKSSHTYQFIDTDPLPGSYYKLKQIDFDGTTSYSRQVFVNSKSSILKLYPNPTKGDFILESTDPDSPVLIYNLRGQKVQEKKGASLNTITTDQLSHGIYIIRVGSQSVKLGVEK